MIDLKKILDKHSEAAGNSRKMKGLLLDHYPDYENEYEIRIILFFMETGIVDDLMIKKQNDQIITAADEKKYLTKIKKRYGVQEETSGPIFRLWTDALELEVEKAEETGPDDDGNSAEMPPDVPAEPMKQEMHPGDTLTFGRYEQDNDPGNGPEAIEWQVLAVEKDRALLISRYGLDVKPYNDKAEPVSWETCTLRAWLNGAFYEKVFGEEEKVRIRESANQNSYKTVYMKVEGKETKDRIFLLSIDEARKYFKNEEARGCRCTAYAAKNAAGTEMRENCLWWLRSPGSSSELAWAVLPDGHETSLKFSAVDPVIMVRPAFWLDLCEDPGGRKTAETVGVSAAVVWDDDNDRDGKRPDKVTLSLIANGTMIRSLEIGAESGWKQMVSGLPKYTDGQENNYSWIEDRLPEGYSLSGYSMTGTETTLTNSHTPETTEAVVKVIWDDGNDRDGIRPDNVFVILGRIGKAVTLSEKNGWTETVKGLPKYSGGKEIEYAWHEGAVPGGYTLSGTVRSGTVTTLTKSHTPKTVPQQQCHKPAVTNLTNSHTPKTAAQPVPAAKPVPAAMPAKEPSSVLKPAVHVGEILTFGRYEQDNDLSNGPEPIEWQVLAVEKDRALLISRFGLDAKPYNEEKTDVTWETCTLRKWLNGTFYVNAFSSEEKLQIREVTNQNPDNPVRETMGGKATKDRIFLLSIDEVKTYFRNDAARICQPTVNVKANGALVKKNSGNTIWWLRSPGDTCVSAAIIRTGGFVDAFGSIVDGTGVVVRPALWLNL